MANTTQTSVYAPQPFRDFIGGLGTYIRAFGFIARHQLWYYVLMPGLISVILGACIAYSAYLLSAGFTQILVGLYPSDWWFASSAHTIARIFSTVILFIASLVTYRSLLMAFIAPFMSPLAAKVQAIETGQPVFDPPFLSFTNFRLILRGLVLNLGNLFREMAYTLLLLLLGLIPIFTPFAPLAILLVQAYYAGFGNLDYTLEKYYNSRDARQFAQRYRYLAIGNGLVFLSLLGIPILGLFLAPALSTVAATLATLKRVSQPVRSVNELEMYI